MNSDLETFLENHTVSEGSTPADLFVQTFLTNINRPHTNGNRTEARALLWEQDLLLCDPPTPTTIAQIPDYGGRVPRSIVRVPLHPITGAPA